MAVRAITVAGAVGVAAAMVTTLWPALARDRTDAAVVLAANSTEDRHQAETLEANGQMPPASVPELSSMGSRSVVYIPPTSGEPRARIGAGGVRSSSALSIPLALAPNHVALTVNASPSLFWYIDALPGREVDAIFTLIDDEMTAPLAEITLDRPGSAGIQRLRLSDLGVRLEPGVEYTWSIALAPDAEQRSNDRVSLGFIRRVVRPEALATGTPDGAAFAEAASGTTRSRRSVTRSMPTRPRAICAGSGAPCCSKPSSTRPSSSHGAPSGASNSLGAPSGAYWAKKTPSIEITQKKTPSIEITQGCRIAPRQRSRLSRARGL